MPSESKFIFCLKSESLLMLKMKLLLSVIIVKEKMKLVFSLQSSYSTRIKRCKQIFQEAILLNPSLGKFISDTTRLADKLIELSNKSVGDSNVISLSENFPSILKLVDEK